VRVARRGESAAAFAPEILPARRLQSERVMLDLLAVAATVAFFALCWAYVRACEGMP
jgi:hypothetical protein